MPAKVEANQQTPKPENLQQHSYRPFELLWKIYS